MNIIPHAIVIGAGATSLMDLWATCLRRFWAVASLDYALLGRWIGHFSHGRFMHESIASAVPRASLATHRGSGTSVPLSTPDDVDYEAIRRRRVRLEQRVPRSSAG